MEETFITKIEINNKPLYVKILNKPTKDDLFVIKIFEEDNSWSGRFSHELAKQCRERVDESEEEYNDSVIKGLSKNSDFICDFILKSDDHNLATFRWKKKFGSATLIYGSVPVHRDEVTESKDNLIDFLIQENKVLKNSVNSVTRKNNDLRVELDKMTEKLEQFVESRIQDQNDLYDRVTVVLNTKKRRIKELEELLNS